MKSKVEIKQEVMKNKRWKDSKERLDPLIAQFLSLSMDVGSVQLKLRIVFFFFFFNLMSLSGKVSEFSFHYQYYFLAF